MVSERVDSPSFRISNSIAFKSQEMEYFNKFEGQSVNRI